VTFEIHENVSLAPLTTFGIGGPARYLVYAQSEDDVFRALDFAKSKVVPLFVLGGGSNLLISDAGFSGLVLHVGLKGVDFEPSSQRVLLRARAGENWDALVAEAVYRGLGGIECLSGIPGSVGGTPVQNVGAYGQEVSEVIVAVRVLDVVEGKVRELSRSDCGFTYRTSIFNSTQKDRFIVLDVTYSLAPGAVPVIAYPDVRQKLELLGRSPRLEDVRGIVLEIRAGKGMVIAPGDPETRSAGSFFKNPIVTEQEFARIQETIALPMPRYPASSGYVKTAAAWLVEQAGCTKGFAMGPAGISQKHTLALVNRSGASANDIMRLAREIRRRVEDRFGVRLVPEPVFLGFDEPF
jgi:UDP-N-acetylmuramate dehydrogenase